MESALLQGLNPNQRQAVQTIDGPLLMLAGPGSGKTRVVTHRLAYMLEQGVPPSRLLALTFTNKAAQEMRSRLERLVGPAPVWMGTFHGFCARLLRQYAPLVGLPSNFNIYDVDDSTACLRTAVEAAKFSLTHVSLGTLANRISYYKNRLVTPETLQAEGLSSDEHAVAQVYPFYQRQLLNSGAVDFDDLLMHTAMLLRSAPELRSELDERYQYVMVDEYQDTNLAQYVIVRHLAIDYPNLAVTGDPDQSIYGWRGANLKNVSYLERDYPNTQIIRLEQNYRSTPEILSVADGLIQNNQYRKHKRLVPSRAAGEPVRLVAYATGRREAEDIVAQIVAAANSGKRQLRDFAILVRTNAHSRLIEQTLVRQQIPYQLIGGFRFYMRKEIKDLVSYLLLLHNPQDDVAWERAINTPPRGIGKQTIAKLKALAGQHRVSLLEACRLALQGAMLGKKIAAGLRQFLDIQDRCVELVHGSLLDLVEAMIEMTDYRSYLLRCHQADGAGDKDALANLDELLAEAAELDRQSLEASPLEVFLEYAALQSDTDRLSTNNCVTVMTLHAAKGLEFPVVFIIAVEENILPHQRSKDDPLAVEEERRLLFVGITRAQDQLQLSYAKRRAFRDSETPGIPSSFLMELPRSDMQCVDLSEPDPFGFDPIDHNDDAYASLSGRWDESEFSQLAEETTAEDASVLEEAEFCQLPADELPQQVIAKLKGRITTAAQLAGDTAAVRQSEQVFRIGRVVTHPEYGSGRIIAASGKGPKRSVTIDFFSSGEQRDFRLSHARLSIESDE